MKNRTAKMFPTEQVDLSSLKPHPRNYRKHSEKQVGHIAQSIKEHGFYRNVVVAKDNTILAGHGVVKAAQRLKYKTIPVVRVNLSVNDRLALKLLAGDNEISNLADIDDRALTEILKEITGTDKANLLGTGYDASTLAALAFVTRPANEIADINEAEAWVGMPEFQSSNKGLQLVVSFKSKKNRDDFFKRLGIKATEKTKAIWWPPQARRDVSSVKFEG